MGKCQIITVWLHCPSIQHETLLEHITTATQELLKSLNVPVNSFSSMIDDECTILLRTAHKSNTNIISAYSMSGPQYLISARTEL
jgi:hypothetical protein